ncbi:MAG: cytochrome-c peroxidase, partial [Limisphaerales bacterium]
PDVKQAQRLAATDQIRTINRQIGELLTESQRIKFAELRAARRPARSVVQRSAPQTDQPGDSDAAQKELEETSHFAPLPPRAPMTDEEYRQLAIHLRTAYSKPAKEWPAPTLDDPVPSYFVELGLLPPVKYPEHNPYTEAKAELGKKLFFDPRLSGSKQISCASCHDAELGWSDGRTVSFGHSRKALTRNSQTLLNVGHNEFFFWDGRSSTLEEQAIEVINNKDEMHSSAEIVREHLGSIPGYTNEFAAVFGSPEVTITRVAQAIATFERTITSRSNPFDSFLRGNTNALSDSAIRGLHLFRTEARCINCHHGPNFTDNRFHDEGLSYFGRKLQDLGRYEVTKDPADVGGFKTPTLRNISRTAPYMHNGLFDLDGVLNLYNAGMPNLRPKGEQKNDPLFPKKSHLLKPLGLNKQDLQDLKAFLEALTEARHRVPPPELP